MSSESRACASGSRWRVLLVGSAVAAVTLTACSNSARPAPSPAATSPKTTSSSPVAVKSSTAAASPAAPNAASSPVDQTAAATAAVAAQIAGQPAGGVSVAAVNLSTGVSFSAGATSGMWTASAYKLFVLETLLLRRQNSGGLTSSQQRQAVPMIEQSDNEDGYDLFEAAGGRSALVAAAATFGMTSTVPGRTDPTFTTTSGADYLILLRNLVVATSPLNAASQAYVLNLMRNVEADQRWGVGVVADPGTDFANKNGWLSIDNTNGPGEDDNGLWAVTSVGIVTVHGQQLLLAVFTQHQPSMAAGVNLVQSLTAALTPAVSG